MGKNWCRCCFRMYRFFLDKTSAGKHINAGAKKVIISAPAKEVDFTVVQGVNSKDLKKEHNIISNGSWTTNCLAPVAMVLESTFGIEYGYMTTIHSYTGDQKLLDTLHKDLRRARSAMNSIIPTKTGAASAVGKVLPSLNGKLDGIALRVPVACGSITDFVCVTEKETTVEEVNNLLQAASNTSMQGILAVSSEPLVSIDIVGRKESSIIDAELTKVDGNLIKLVSWYDNETGYSARLIDLCSIVTEKELTKI